MLSSFAEISRTLPWFYPAVAAAFGLIVGSFLNVCIYRIPAGKSVVRPGSHCACGQPIAWHDNIPVLSWLFLRGRARCCGRPISARYPIVELLTGAAFFLCWHQFGPAKAACGMVLSSALICASFTDLDSFEIPDVFTVGLGIAGFLLSVLVPSLHNQASDYFIVASLRSTTIALQGMCVGAGLVLWIAMVAYAVLKKDAMGMADVKLVGAIGAFCGWQGTITSVFGGALLGSIWFIGALTWEKISGKKIQLKTPEKTGEPAELGFGVHVPFGPMIALAGLLHFLYLHTWVAKYFSLFSGLL